MPGTPAQGQLLISSSRLLEPNFVRTVLLLVRHDELDGSLGLILNRPLEMSVKDACEKVLEKTCDAKGVLHQGGPCEGPLMAVHDREDASEHEVLPGIHFTTEREKLESLLDDADATVKYFVGYSGWTLGQLQDEIDSGSWILAPANKLRVFDEDDEQWSRLMTELTFGRYIKPDQIPDDPSMN